MGFFQANKLQVDCSIPTHSSAQEGCLELKDRHFLLNRDWLGGDVAAFPDNPPAYPWPSLRQESKSEKAEGSEVSSRNLKACYRGTGRRGKLALGPAYVPFPTKTAYQSTQGRPGFSQVSGCSDRQGPGMDAS